MRYIRFYRVMKLMVPTGQSFLGSIGLVMAHMVVINLFMSESGVTTVGFTALFMMAVFIMSAYARQMRFDSLCPVWDYPMTSKERVTFTYLSIPVTFFTTMLVLVLFGYLIFGIASMLGSVTVTDGDVAVTNVAGDLYMIGWNLLLMSWVFPLSYVESSKKRLVLIFGGYVVFALANLVLGSLLAGELFIRDDIRLLFLDHGHAWVFMVPFVVFALVSVWVSYKVSLHMNSYQKTAS
jgi:hypothetical protein